MIESTEPADPNILSAWHEFERARTAWRLAELRRELDLTEERENGKE